MDLCKVLSFDDNLQYGSPLGSPHCVALFSDVLCLLDSLGMSLQFRGMPASLWWFMNLTAVCSKKSTTMVAAACVALPAVN